MKEMLIFPVVVFLIAFIYIAVRARSAVVGGYVSGFLLNPLFYLVFFGLFYLVVASLLVNVGGYEIFEIGRYRSDLGLLKKSTRYSLFSYLVLFLFYVVSVDKRLGSLNINLGNNTRMALLLLGAFLCFYLTLVVYRYFLEIYTLRQSRVSAFSYYVEHVWYGMRYSFFLNLTLFFVFVSIIGKNKNNILSCLVFFVAVLVMAIDYSHGGRSASIKMVMAIYLAVAIKNNKFYFLTISLALFSMLLLGVLQRVGGGGVDINSIYFLFSEFILTRYVTDIIMYHGVEGDFLTPLLSFFSSYLPGFVRSSLGAGNAAIGGFVQSFTGLSFGLASNVVAESIYYFGRFYIVSMFITGSFFYALNRMKLKRIPSLLIIFFYIVNIQNMFRTSFYDLGLSVFYVVFFHLFFFVFIFWKKRVVCVQK